ncbi:unnamed protein product [Nezara viridula]|uniref:Generative cell specific-1/HAP2 domain-containing protein n=3 Tax=Nezara viridula TaxID=85310 RepID=A0A9P0H4K7_NEZVI|nr:unnamed protein product [Nezara viridula]
MLMTPIDKANSNRNKELAKETKSNQKGRRYYLRIRSKNHNKPSTTIKPDIATCKHCCTTTKSINQVKPFPNLNPNIEKLHQYMNKEVLKNTTLNNHGLLKRSLHKLNGLIKSKHNKAKKPIKKNKPLGFSFKKHKDDKLKNPQPLRKTSTIKSISTMGHLKHPNRPKLFKSFLRRGFRQRDKTEKISQTVTAPANITLSTTLPTTLGIKENNSSQKYTSRCTINPVDKTNEYLITIVDDEEELEESETHPWKDDDIFEEFSDSVDDEVIFECEDNGLQNNLKGKTVIEAAHLFTDVEQNECTSSLLDKMKFQSRKFAGMNGKYVTEKNPTDDEKIVIIDGEHPERSDENNKIFIETVESSSEMDQNSLWFREEEETDMETTTKGDVVIIDGEHPERSDENNKIFIENVYSSSETDQNNQWFSEEAKTDVETTTEGNVVIIDGEHPERSDENNKIFIENVYSSSETDQNNQWFSEEAKTDVETTTEGNVVIIDGEHPERSDENNKIFIENVYSSSETDQNNQWFSEEAKTDVEKTTEGDVIIIDSNNPAKTNASSNNKIFVENIYVQSPLEMEQGHKSNREKNETEPTTESDVIIIDTGKTDLSKVEGVNKEARFLDRTEKDTKIIPSDDEDLLNLCNKRTKLLKEKLDQIPQHHLGSYKTSTDVLNLCNKRTKLLKEKLDQIPQHHLGSYKTSTDVLNLCNKRTKLLKEKLNQIPQHHLGSYKTSTDVFNFCNKRTKLLKEKLDQIPQHHLGSYKTSTDVIILNSDTKEKSEDSSKKSILSEKSKSLKADKSIESQDGGNKSAAENNSDVLNLCNKRTKFLKEKLDQIPQHHLGSYKTSTDVIIVNSDPKEKSEDSSKKSILSEKSKSSKTDKFIKSQAGGNKGAAENNSDVLNLCNKRTKLLKEKLDQIPQHHLGSYKTSTDVMIINSRITPRTKKHKSYKNFFLDSSIGKAKKGSFSFLVKGKNQMNAYRKFKIRKNRTKFISNVQNKSGVGVVPTIILMKNGDSLKINESNKIKFLGKLSSSLKIDKSKKHKSNKQNKSGKGIDTNRGNNVKTKILHILHIPEKNSMITTTNDYQKFIIINNAVTPRLDEFNSPHKVFLESMKKKERKKFKFPLKNQNSKNRFKKLKKKNKLKSKIQKKILSGIHLDNKPNSIFKLNKSILHYKEPLKKVLKIKNSSLAIERIKVLTGEPNISMNSGVGIKNVTLGKNRQKKTKVKNITSSPVSEQVNKPKDIGLAGNTLKALKDIMKFVKVFLNLRSKNVTRKIENPSLLHKQKKKTEALDLLQNNIDSVEVTSPINKVLNNSKSKNQALEKKSNFNVHKNKDGSEYVGFLQNKTDAVGIISHKKEALNSSKSRNHSIKKTLDRQIMVPEDNGLGNKTLPFVDDIRNKTILKSEKSTKPTVKHNDTSLIHGPFLKPKGFAMENNDSHGPGNKSETVDLLKIMNTTSKGVVLTDLNKTIYGYSQSQANKSKNYLKDFVILLLQHFIGKMFVNIPKKPSNFTKVGVNLTNPEMKETPNDWVEEFDNVSYKMYYNPETLTDYYKDDPKEKSVSSVNLDPGGQLLNIAYKVENLLNALSSFENANKPDEAINNNINVPKSAYHNPKKQTGMSKVIHQLKEDIEELDDVLFHNKSEETIEFSLESNQSEPNSSSFEPAINESYDLSRDTRQISISGVQKRGGQSCVDRYIPTWANPFTYHESAHCLRFSDLWYSVYRLKDPFIYHSVYFEVFEKNCKTYENSWKLSTGGDIVQIGTFHRKSIDEGPSIVFTYTPFSATNNKYFCFDPLLHQIMVPRIVPQKLLHKYPQVDEGPGRYLLVSPSGISHDGEDCDKAGVGYSAFASQPDRCNKPAGSCLLNQPLDFWQHDTDALAHNKSGNYFLDNFAAVEDSSVKIAEGKQFLTVGYSGHYTSVVEIEMRLDDNIVIRNESPALIHEVLIDSTCEHQTKITIKVTNAGYVSTAYRPKITNCPVNVPNIWYDNEGPLVYIAPFRVHVFRVTLYGTSRPSRFHCSGLIKAIYGSLCYRRLALMHLHMLCPRFYQSARLMPAVCPCRREVIRPNSARSVSSHGSKVADPQSKRPATVL